METSYDVRIWKVWVYEGKRGKTHHVRWKVAGRPFREPFRVAALADSFRSQLVTAARTGEAFDVESGLPITMRRAGRDLSWYAFACEYVDLKWPRVAATTRRTHAEAFTAVTTAMFTSRRGKPDDKLLRRALCRWGFNTVRRPDVDCPAEVREALRWVEKHTMSLSSLTKPDVLRSVMDRLSVRLDGGPTAPSVLNRRRKIFSASLEYAVERELLPANPVAGLKWKPPQSVLGRPVQQVDRRSVANPRQVRTLLEAVGDQVRSGPRLVAYFACLYFAALRPEEAVALARHHLALPAEGWGELYLQVAEPHAGKEWTDSGDNRDRRQLKQRAVGESRTVPCPPELTALLRKHMATFGTGPDGRLFFGERNQRELPKLTIIRAWQRARQTVFIPEVAASRLAATPYDLRHAAVSTWLNAGVPVTDVAQWAGHSVEVLLKTYAKCIDGGAQVLRQRIEEALRT